MQPLTEFITVSANNSESSTASNKNSKTESNKVIPEIGLIEKPKNSGTTGGEKFVDPVNEDHENSSSDEINKSDEKAEPKTTTAQKKKNQRKKDALVFVQILKRFTFYIIHL